MTIHRFPAPHLALPFVLTLLAAASRAPAAVATIDLENPSISFALNPDTGLLAAAEPEKSTVRFYPKASSDQTAEGATSLAVGKSPVSILYKKFGADAYFVVLCYEGPEVDLVNAKSLQIVKKIPLTNHMPMSVIASTNDQDPYVYIPTGENNMAQNPGVGVIDLRTGSQLDNVFITGSIAGNMSEGAISADGRIAYGRSTGVSPSGMASTSLDWQDAGKPPRTSRIIYNHTDVPGYVPDPTGQSVAVGNNLYSADLRTTLQDLQARVVCFLPHRPFMVALVQQGNIPPAPRGRAGRGGFAGPSGQLVLISDNSHQKVGAPQSIDGVDFSNGPWNQSLITISGRQFRNAPAVLADPKNDMLLVCTQNSVKVLSLKDFDPPNEPFMVAKIDGPARLVVGKPATFKITRRDPATKLQLDEAPKGMSLQGDTLTWTPSADDIGDTQASLRLTAGTLETSQNLPLHVSREFAQLPFEPTTFELAPDASVALIATTSSNNSFNPMGQPPPNARLALIDLKTSSVLADRTLLNAASTIAFDSRYVYAGLRDSDAFYVLSRKDLSEVKRLFSPGRATALQPRGDKLIVITASGAAAIYKTSDFSLLDSPAARPAETDPSIPRYNQNASTFLDLGDDVELNGIFLDPSLEKIRAIEHADALRVISSQNGQVTPISPYGIRAVSRWGVAVDSQGSLFHASGPEIGRLVSKGSVISAQRPLIASFTIDTRNAGTGLNGGTITRCDIAFRNVIDGAVQQTVRIFDEPQRQQQNQSPFPGDLPPHIRLAAGKAVLLDADRLFLVDVPAPDATKYPTPVQFNDDQGVIVLSPDKPTVIHFSATSSAPPVEYSLAHEIPGVVIDKSGTVTIQPGTWTDSAVDSFGGALNNTSRFALANLRSQLATYQQSAAPAFKKLTGREPMGIPAAVSISVVARDQNLQTTTADRLILIEIPTALVDARIKAQEAKDSAADAAAPAPAGAGGFGPRGATPAREQTARNDEQDARIKEQAARIDALDKRVDELNAKIDLLTKLLSDKNK